MAPEAQTTDSFENLDVRSYFLDAGIGDAAIHCLVDRKTKCLKSSVLVDSGTGPSKHAIASAVRRLPELVAEHAFRFDAVVLSRFSENHHGGLLDLLYEDWLSKTPHASSYTTADSVFYCPFMASGVRVHDKLNTRIEQEHGSGEFHLKFKGPQPEDQWMIVCRAVPSTFALGYDLFSNTPFDGDNFRAGPPSTEFPVTFEAVHEGCRFLVERQQPIFLVFGIDGCNLVAEGQSRWPPANESWKSTENQFKARASSIWTLIMWPTSTKDPKNPTQRISLYCGSSVSRQQEYSLINWCELTTGFDVVKTGPPCPSSWEPKRVLSHKVQHFISTGYEAEHLSLESVYGVLAVAHELSPSTAPTISLTRIPPWLTQAKNLTNSRSSDVSSIMSWRPAALALEKILENLTSLARQEEGSTSFILKMFGDEVVHNAVALAFESQGLEYCKKMIEEYPESALSKIYHAWSLEKQQICADSELFSEDDTVQLVQQGIRGEIKALWAAQGWVPDPVAPHNARWVKTLAAGNSLTVVRSTSAVTCVVSAQTREGAEIWNSPQDVAWVDALADSERLTSSQNPNFNPDIRIPAQQAQEPNESTTATGGSPTAPEQPSYKKIMPPICNSSEEWIWRRFMLDIEPLNPEDDATFTAEQSKCAAWFGNCFSSIPSLGLKWSLKAGEPVMDRVDLLLTLKRPDEVAKQFKALVVGDDLDQRLQFTTSPDAQEHQFGKDAAGRLSPCGYSADLNGIVLALKITETPGSRAKFTLTQHSRFVGFPVPSGKLSKLFDSTKLEPYVPAANGGHPGRSGIWFMPQFNSRTITRVQMSLAADSGEVTKLLSETLGFLDMHDALFVGECHCESQGPKYNEVSSKLCMQATISLPPQSASTKPVLPAVLGKTEVAFSNTGAELVIKFEHSEGLLVRLLAWALDLMFTGSATPSMSSQTAASDTAAQIQHLVGMVLGSVQIFVSRIKIGLDADLKPFSFAIDIEVAVPVHDTQHVPFLTSICWDEGTFDLSMRLWPRPANGPTSDALYPFFEDTALGAPQSSFPVYTVPIRALFRLSDDVQFPSMLPDTVSAVDIHAIWSSEDGSASADLSAEFLCATPRAAVASVQDPSQPPALRFDKAALQAATVWASKDAKPDSTIVFLTTVSLSEHHPATKAAAGGTRGVVPINLVVSYNREDGKPSWIAAGSIANVTVAHLYDLFAGDGSSDAIMELMGNVNISVLGVKHIHGGQDGNELHLNGKLIFGASTPTSIATVPETRSTEPVELDFTYLHTVTGGWQLNASIPADAAHSDFRLLDLLKDMVPEWQELPEFIQNSTLSTNVQLNLVCTRTKTDEVVLALDIAIGDVNITMAQISSVTAAKAASGSKAKPMADDKADSVPDRGDHVIHESPGRILWVAVRSFPAIPDIPLVGDVPQPFDELSVVWTNRDITAVELKALEECPHTQIPLLRKSGKAATDVQPLAKGVHFQLGVLENGETKLVVDTCTSPEPASKPTQAREPAAQSAKDKAKPVESESTAGISKAVAPMSKTFGPLSVRNIGLLIDPGSTSTIKISVDASLTLGPLSVSLLGLSLAVDFSGVKNWHDLGDLTFKASIQGMAMEYNKPPTRLAGLFTSFDDAAEHGFEGAVAVSMATWSGGAGGMYTESKSAKHNESFFVFGVIRGPIVTIGAVELDGLTGGFGYNSHLRLPDLPAIADFPFLALNQTAGPQPELTDELHSMSGGDQQQPWITPVKDDMWLVAGLGFKAFQTIDGQILVAMALSDEPKFSVLAQATAVFPKSAVSSGDPLEHALLVLDIVMGADIDPVHGTIVCGGKLTPRSFILDKSCHLTGAFAMAFFLEGSPHEGDFSFSVGGYARSYRPPARYPPAPDRVGISWRYDDDISITGQAYFAVTPQVVMGGGRLDLVFDKSWVHVLFSAWADFFIHLHPFSFLVDIGISLTASLSIPAFFFTIHFGPYDFSADLTLFGPPLGGRATIDLWGYPVHIAFGSSQSSPPALTWPQFVRLVKDLPAEAPATTAEAEITNHIVTFTKGLIPPEKAQKPRAQQSQSPAVIYARGNHLALSVQSRIPILSLRSTIPLTKAIPAVTLNARPMLLPSPITYSLLYVQLKHEEDPSIGSEISETPLRCIRHTQRPVAPSLFGPPAGLTATAATARDKMIMHTMEVELEVPENARMLELPVIDMKSFNSTNVGDANKNVIVTKPGRTLEESGVVKAMHPKRQAGPRGLTHMSGRGAIAGAQTIPNSVVKAGLGEDAFELWRLCSINRRAGY